MNTNNQRKIYALLMLVLLLVGCKKDDATPAAAGTTLADLGGSWTITAAFGTEWEKTAGIITPKAADPDAVGSIIVIGLNPTTFSYFPLGGTGVTGTIALAGDLVTVTVGTDVLEFTLKNKTATGMQWDQREPNKDSDYEFNSGAGNFLYFQKFWTLTKN